MTEDRVIECDLCGDEHEVGAPCDEDEAESEKGARIRGELSEELPQAHAAAVVMVKFPRPENDVDEVHPESATFLTDEADDLTRTEVIAAKKLLDMGLERLGASVDGAERHATAMAIPANLSALGGGSSGESSDGGSSGSSGVGFQ